MSEEKPPLFVGFYGEDGALQSVTVDYWPDRLRVSTAVLDVADPRFITREADEITFRCANGEATYRIVACDRDDVYHTEAVTRSWWGLAA